MAEKSSKIIIKCAGSPAETIAMLKDLKIDHVIARTSNSITIEYNNEKYLFSDNPISMREIILQRQLKKEVLDRAENLRKGKHGITGENRLVGTIPMHVIQTWCKEAGIKWSDLEARKEIVRKNILSGEFDKLRVWKGTF